MRFDSASGSVQIIRLTNMYLRKIVFMVLAMFGLAACEAPSNVDKGVEAAPDFQQSLPLADAPFDILADDVDGDGRLDLTAISHGENYAQVFYQKAVRVFTPGPRSPEVGFHPGDIIRVQSAPPKYLVAGEGLNQLVILDPAADGGFKQTGHLGEAKPRYATVFRWPGWGLGLAVSPYLEDEIVLLKNFDPNQVKAESRVSVPFVKTKNVRTLRRAERMTVADIDGNGVDELLFTSHRTNELWMIPSPKAGEEVNPVLLQKFQQGYPRQVVAADVNDDKKLDLVVPDQIEPFQLHMLLNDGQGKFNEASPLPFPTTIGLRQVAIARDKDSINYVLASGYGAIALYRLPVAWDGKAPVPMQSVGVISSEGSSKVLLQDIDGDGWLDGVVGRGKGGNAVWVVYGPLWEHFQELTTKKFMLN